MPWFTAWPESIKKRACRYLLQHYLGQFLQEKLSLEQLSVDLYNGTGHVNNVPLDIWSLNELLDQAHVPIELVDGYIGSIVVSIPWSALLSDNCKVEIKGLEITLQPKYRNDTELSNMTDSFYRSLGNMTTSMQLAEECLKGQGNESQNTESGGLFEGLEVFAQTIESVLSRVKVSLVDTLVRIEHLPENSKTGIGLEVHIERIEYFDEKTMNVEPDSPSNSKENQRTEGDSKETVYQRDSITSKRFRATGIKVLLEEFPEQMRTSPRGSVEAFPTGSPDRNTTGPIHISCSPDTQFQAPKTEDKEVNVEEMKTDGPLVIGKFFGWQELKLRIKQSDHVAVPNLDAECYMGSFSMFLTPHQVHLLSQFANGIVSPNSTLSTNPTTQHEFISVNSQNPYADHGIKLSPDIGSLHFESSERRRFDLENIGSRDRQYRYTDLEDEDQFFSMEASKTSESTLGINLPPIGAPSEYGTSIYSEDSQSTDFTQSSVSTAYRHIGSRQVFPKQPAYKLMGAGGNRFSPIAATIPCDIEGQTPSHNHGTNATKKQRSTNYGEDKATGFNNCHYQFQIRALAITVLHINPLPPSTSPSHTHLAKNPIPDNGSNVDNDQGSKSCNKKSNHLSEMSENYFVECEALLENVIKTDIKNIRDDLAALCCPHDHLRLTAAHIHMDSKQKTASISDTEVSIGRAEVTECLFSFSKSTRNSPRAERSERKYNSQSKSAACKIPTHSEILVFEPDQYASNLASKKSMYMSFYSGTAPNIKLHVSSHEKHRSSKTSLYIHLSDCQSEVDISIVDRISTLIYPPDTQAKQQSTTTSLFSPTSLGTPFHSDAVNRQAVFNEALIDDYKEKQMDFNISASFLKINFRFPIADLRPEMERRPWYTRSLRDEILVLEARDIGFVSSSIAAGTQPLATNNAGMQGRGSSAVSQQPQEFEITVKDLHVLYSDETNKPPKSFLRISQSTTDMEPLGGPMDVNSDLDCPHIKITINPSQLETTNTLLRGANTLTSHQSSRRNDERFEDNEMPSFDDDFPMTGSQENLHQTNPSPFSQRKVIYDSEEMILPGDSSEIQSFCEYAVSTAQISISLSFPAVNVFLISKTFFENLYNRINNDILLWEPAAPRPHRRCKNGFDSRTVSYLGDGGLPDQGLDLASQLLLNSQVSAFNMQLDSNEFAESDSDSDDTYYDKPSFGAKKVQKSGTDAGLMSGRQSLIAVTTRIGHGRLSARCNLLLDDGTVSRSEHGEIVIMLENANIFNVARYCGNPLLDYVCVQVNCCRLHHKAAIPSLHTTNSVVEKLTTEFPDHLEKVIGRSEDGISDTFASGTKIGTGPDSQNMVTVAIKIETEESRPMKQCLVAASVSGVTLYHKFAKTGHSWLEQLIDFIDATDDKVLGYEPPSFITEMHLNVRDSAAVYHPMYMTPPIGVVVTASSFSLSSNIVAGAPVSVLRIIIDEANLYITDRCNKPSIELLQDYVCILDVNVFEICLKLSNETPNDTDADGNIERHYPLIDLQASNNMVRLRTCADSCAAIGALVRYLADDGDLAGTESEDDFDETVSNFSRRDEEFLSPCNRAASPLTNSDTSDCSHKEKGDNVYVQKVCEESEEDSELPDLMADAMEEVFVDARSDLEGFANKGNTAMTESMYTFSNDDVGTKPSNYPSNVKNIMSQSVMIPPTSNRRKMRGQKNHHSYKGGRSKSHQATAPDDEEFCIIDDPGMGIIPRSGEPEVKYRDVPGEEGEENQRIHIQENYFKPTLGKVDQLRAPEHFPTPVVRYTLKELSCVWSMFGGSDFENCDRKRSGSGRGKDLTNQQYSPKKAMSSPVQLKYNARKGSINFGKQGQGRDPTMLMELHLIKVRSQHEQYPDDTFEAARTVVIISDFEVRDRLQSSRINKFLYRFHSEASPKQAHAKTLLVKALQIRPEGAGTPPECRLRISLQPLRLNVDQDTLSFLTKFFADLSNSVSEDEGSPSHWISPSSAYETAAGSSNTGNTRASPKVQNTPYSSPVMTRTNVQPKIVNNLSATPPSNNSSPLLQETSPLRKNSNVGSNSSLGQTGFQQPLFFRELVFSPEVPIRLDYHGKRIDTEQGTFAGLLMGLGQLNCSQLKLKRVVHRHGLLGADKLISHLLNEWAADIRANQLPLILGGVGPMHSVVQLFQGVRDLVWLPVEQYRKDGRLVRGLQRGATSFGTSTAMATLEITNRAIGLVQSAAETAYELVSPAELNRRERHARRNWKTLGHHAIRRQPADIREGMSNAFTVVKHGVEDTAGSIVRVARKEHERKGVTGAVGGVLRHIPPALVRPVIMATEATTNVLSGIRNQIQPDAKQQDEDKWKDMDAIEII